MRNFPSNCLETAWKLLPIFVSQTLGLKGILRCLILSHFSSQNSLFFRKIINAKIGFLFSVNSRIGWWKMAEKSLQLYYKVNFLHFLLLLLVSFARLSYTQCHIQFSSWNRFRNLIFLKLSVSSSRFKPTHRCRGRASWFYPLIFSVLKTISKLVLNLYFFLSLIMQYLNYYFSLYFSIIFASSKWILSFDNFLFHPAACFQ